MSTNPNDSALSGIVRQRSEEQAAQSAPPNTAAAAVTIATKSKLNDSSSSSSSSENGEDDAYERSKPHNDEERVSAVARALPNAAYASSDKALQLKHIDALQPATVNVDEMMEWVKAKMGRGMDTVLDESRRRCKVLVPKAAAESDSTTRTAAAAAATSAAPVAAARPNIVHWPGLEAAIESTRKQLCPWFPPGSLHAHLHTVQQYDEGDFFTLHRDTPKLPYHIITLSVDCSPPGMTHKGGEIRLDPQVYGNLHFEGSQTTFGSKVRFAGSGSFAAWFNTTYHEILPVTKGRRMSATFNITVDAAVATLFTCDDPTIEKAVAEAAAKLRPLGAAFDSKKCFVLDGEYVFDPNSGDDHVYKLQGRDRLMHEAVCRAFGHGRVVLSAHELEQQRMYDGPQISLQPVATKRNGGDGSRFVVVDECGCRDKFYHRAPFREHHADAGNEGGTHTMWWRVAALSLTPSINKEVPQKNQS